MKKLIILMMKDDNFSRGEINYINRPNLGNSFIYGMKIDKVFFGIYPFYYYESTGSIGAVGFGYSEILYG
jgi:hypothetical protein